RRIEAVSGETAIAYLSEQSMQISRLASLLKSEPQKVFTNIKTLIEKSRQQEKDIERLKSKLAATEGDSLLDRVEEVNGVKLLAAKIDGDTKTLRETVDQLKNKMGSGVVAL